MNDFKTTGYRSSTFNGKGGPKGHTRAGREFARRLVESENYRKWLYDRIESRTLSDAIEKMLWTYAYGVPKQYIELTSREHDLADAPADLLADRARKLATILSQIGAATSKAEAERLIQALAAIENEDEDVPPSPTPVM